MEQIFLKRLLFCISFLVLRYPMLCFTCFKYIANIFLIVFDHSERGQVESSLRVNRIYQGVHHGWIELKSNWHGLQEALINNSRKLYSIENSVNFLFFQNLFGLEISLLYSFAKFCIIIYLSLWRLIKWLYTFHFDVWLNDYQYYMLTYHRCVIISSYFP